MARTYGYFSSGKRKAIRFGVGVALATFVASVAYVDSIQGVVAGAEQLESVDSVSVDVITTRQLVDAAGNVIRQGKPELHRLERTLVGDHWKTTWTQMTDRRLTVTEKDGSESLLPPIRSIAMVEDDGDGTAPRMYDVDHQLIAPPDVALRAKSREMAAKAGKPDLSARLRELPHSPRKPLTGRAWLEAMVIPVEKRVNRARALENEYGRVQGRLRGLDRYVMNDGKTVVEALVDPDAAIPVEMNVVTSGQLVNHATFRYAPEKNGVRIRNAMRFEQLAGEKAEQRSIVESTYSNLKMTAGGKR